MSATLSPTTTQPKYLTRKRAAAYLTCSTTLLDRLHAEGRGPKRLNLSTKRVVYATKDLDDWLASEKPKAPKRATETDA